MIEFYGSASRAVEHGRQAAELAERHGWADEPGAGVASVIVGAVLVWQGRLEEAELWIQRAERIVRAEAEPAVRMAEPTAPEALGVDDPAPEVTRSVPAVVLPFTSDLLRVIVPWFTISAPLVQVVVV